MPFRISAVLIFLPSLIVPILAQQKPDNPWDVIGGYVCSQTAANSAPEELYLLPDMTWSRTPPFTSFAAREHLSYSYSFRQPENLPDWMQVGVFTMRRRHSYQMFANSGWGPRIFRYQGDRLSLYTVEQPPRRIPWRRAPPSFEMMSLFREFRLDPVTQELRQFRADTPLEDLFVCRRSALF